MQYVNDGQLKHNMSGMYTSTVRHGCASTTQFLNMANCSPKISNRKFAPKNGRSVCSILQHHTVAKTKTQSDTSTRYHQKYFVTSCLIVPSPHRGFVSKVNISPTTTKNRQITKVRFVLFRTRRQI